jgi:uncharacterized protein (DUF697 family)
MVDEKKVEETPVAVPAAEASPAPKELTKEEQAKAIMHKYMWGNAAVGLVPIPVLDIFAVGGVQLAMLKSISKVYGIEFRHDFVKPLIGAFIGATGFDIVSKSIYLGLARYLPPFGMIAGILSFPIVSAASTYAVAKIFIQHFEAGGTLLDFNPSKMKAYFAQYYKEGLEVATKLGDKPEEVKEPALAGKQK